MLDSTVAGTDIYTKSIMVGSTSPATFLIYGTVTGLTIQPEVSSDGVDYMPWRDPGTSAGFFETITSPLALSYCGMLNYCRLKISGGTGTIDKVVANS